MNCFEEDNIIMEDIISISNSTIIDWNNFEGKTIFITGATGLLGSQIVKTLIYVNKIKSLNIKLLLLVRNYQKAKEVFGENIDNVNVKTIEGDIMEMVVINEKVDYIIHGACPTSSKFFVEKPVETIDIITNGTKNMLELAKIKNVSGFMFLSSLEVYGTPLHSNSILENDYGYIDNLNVRSSYSEGKRLAECLCVSYCKEFDIPTKIVRLSQTFGPGVEYNDGRVFAEFIRSAIEKKDIVLHTQGKTVRTYCYTKDTITAILFLLLNGKNGEAYNVTNPETAISIKEMAQLVCDTFAESNINVKIDIPDDVEKYGYNPEMIIKLNTNKIESMGWKATIGLKEMFERTKKSMERKRI